MWPPVVGSYVVMLLGLSWRIGCVGSHQRDSVTVLMLERSPNPAQCPNALWVDTSDEVTVQKQSVLPMTAQLEVVDELSKRTRSGRQIVYKLVNVDAITAMTAGL